MTTPYQPQFPMQSPLRALYRSIAQVTRLQASLVTGGTASVSWQPVTDILDMWLDQPGLIKCRLDLQFVRPGKDQPMPLVAGRAPDRVGVLFFDPATDENGLPLIKAGDRLVMVSGPVTGTFEMRVVPDPAQDLLGTHHMEVQVIETSQALQPGSLTPFPGSRP